MANHDNGWKCWEPFLLPNIIACIGNFDTSTLQLQQRLNNAGSGENHSKFDETAGVSPIAAANVDAGGNFLHDANDDRASGDGAIASYNGTFASDRADLLSRRHNHTCSAEGHNVKPQKRN
eukprot:3843576-Karenia_brevis.AAC.1